MFIFNNVSVSEGTHVFVSYRSVIGSYFTLKESNRRYKEGSDGVRRSKGTSVRTCNKFDPMSDKRFM